VVVDKASVIENIAGVFQDYSNIIPVRKLKDGSLKGNSEGNLLSEQEFTELQKAVDKKVKELCCALVDGCIDIRPMRSATKSACTYCGYKSVCSIDISADKYNSSRI
jgi:ATP-dependent helicase/nuclease subunit B